MAGRERVYLAWAAVAVLLWIAGAAWLVPDLIARVHRGEGFALLERMLSGRASHPLSDYLDAWRSLAWRLSGLLTAVLLLGWALVRWWRPIRRVAERVLLAEDGLSVSRGFAVATGLGLASGFADFLAWRIRYRIDGRFAAWSNPDTVWLAPLVLAVAFGLAFVPFAVAARLSRRRLAARPLIAGWLALGAFGAIRALRLGVHPAAAALLALGVAVLLSRLPIAARLARARGLRRAVVAAAAAFILLGVLMGGGRRLREWSLLRALPAAPAGAANVLLVILDTVRAHSLGLYGHTRPTTPRLAALARRGITFDRAFAPAPWTLPSHATMFTGRHPHEHGADWARPLDARHPTLAEYLAARGYATAGFVANLFYATRASGLARGFAHYSDYGLQPDVILSSTFLTRSAGEWIAKQVSERRELLRKDAPAVSAEFLAWLDRRGTRPFFAFLNYFDAHGPYRLYGEHLRRIGGAAAPDSVLRADGTWVRRSERQRRALDAYESSIAYVDAQLGVLFDELERRGLLENTLIVLTSDHGEQFGMRGLADHGNSLYAQLLHVPLIVVPPRSRTAPAGVRYDGSVGLATLPATIVDALGLATSAPFPGPSLLAFVDGTGGADDGLPALSHVTPDRNVEPASPLRSGAATSLLLDDLHYIRNGNGTEELFAVDEDPRETMNIAAAPASARVLRRLRARLDALDGMAARAWSAATPARTR